VNYLTPEEAADKILGWTGRRRGRRLIALVLRKERVEQREIAIRGPGSGNGIRYGLTEPMLRLHFPELFAPQIDALAVELRRRVDQLKATIGAEVDERMAPQVQQLRSAHERLTSEVTRLATSTNDGFQRLERRIGKIEHDRKE
jgi:hypothetical protein